MKTARGILEFAEDQPIIGSLLITKLVHVDVPVRASRDGGTFGSLIDAHIAQCIEDGEDVHEITIGINPDHWQEMKAGR